MSAPRRRLLLIGWDAADWNLIHPFMANGDLPALRGLMEQGAWGNLVTLQPMVSPMLWNTIATGQTPDRHGVLGFTEPGEGGRGLRPWSSLSRRCKAIWNILMQQGWHTSTVGWWASHPAEPLNGVVVANTIMDARPDVSGRLHAPPGCIHPPERAGAWASCRMMPQEISEEHLLPFVPRAAEVDQERDRRLGSLADLLTSGVTIQSAATRIMETEPWEFLAVYFDGIDHFCHTFMPYHPPRMDHIREREFDLYKDVVRGAYRFHDMMLERLLQLAGPETTVILCSDHGFLSGPNRPLASPNDPAGPTLWHRDMGVLVISGPGVKPGSRIYGASLLDITPTLLALCDLPAGRDMPGKPLAEILTSPVPDRIPSWEEVPGNDGRHLPGATYGQTAPDSTLTQQLVAIGYIEDPSGDETSAAQSAQMEADYNLAQVYLSHGRPDEALPLLESLLGQRPWESRFIHQLAHGYTQAGWHAQAAELLRRAYPQGADPPPPAVFLLMARACIGMGDKNTAAWYAARAASRLPVLSGACVELGNLELTLQNFPAAERAFRRALALDPSMASAHEGLSSVFLRTGENERALEAALEAVELIHQSAGAHLNLGIALARLGSFVEARAAFRRVTVMRPQHPLAWRFLAALPDDSAQGDFLSAACRENARRLSRTWATVRQDERSRSRQLRPLPPIPSPAERLACANAARPDRDFSTVAGPVGRTFTIVSGLPRSGTSLMMQMLEAGGLLPLTDGLRSADTDNPHGYYEWEPIKSIARQPDLLDTDGYDRRAIKCISALLRSLPSKHRYRVIFMSRPIGEIVPSQERMKQRLGTAGATGDPAAIAAVLTKHRDDTLLFLQQRPVYFEVLEIDYPSLVANPAPWIEKLTTFLGPELLPHPGQMAAAVQPALHRNRQANSL